jgi:CheY-like chemotaxis protein
MKPVDMNKLSPLRVMIVDDNLADAKTVAGLVEDMGYLVRLAESQPDLMELDTFRPDVVLIDLRSPELKGLEVCRAIRADPRHWHLWVIAMSGHGDLITVAGSGESGFDVGIPKPVDAVGLEKLLAQFEVMVGRG